MLRFATGLASGAPRALSSHSRAKAVRDGHGSGTAAMCAYVVCAWGGFPGDFSEAQRPTTGEVPTRFAKNESDELHKQTIT